MNEVQPMPSTRISEGRYAVLGTSTECIVERHATTAWTRWHLYVGGAFHRHFRTKRRALQYCQEHPEL